MDEFEWDEAKRLLNLERHRLDFNVARVLFDGRPQLTVLAPHRGEVRRLTIGLIDGKFHTIVWTWRDNVRRIISFRRSRFEEEWKYRDLHPGGA